MNVVTDLMKDSGIAKCGYQSLARLLPSAENLRYSAGEIIYQSGFAADYFYLLQEGTVRLVSPHGTEFNLFHSRFGEEAATDLSNYLTDARADTDVTVWRIPRKAMAKLILANPSLQSELLFSLSSHLVGEKIESSASTVKKISHGQGNEYTRLFGWSLTILMPVLLFFFGHKLGLELNAIYFLVIISAAVSMWVFSLVDEYIPAIYALLASMLLSLAPGEVILSGFSSNGFLMALSTFAISIVLVSSGLSYRFMLFLLYKLPNTQFWQHAGLFATGVAITPIIPTNNGRMAMVSPYYVDLVEILGLKRDGLASTQLAVACFNGLSIFSAMFLSSKSVNFIVYGMLPTQGKDQFQWLPWLFASLVAVAVVLIIHIVATWFLLRHHEKPRLNKSLVAAQLDLLGPLKQREWAAVFCIVFFLVGIVTESIHRIEASWLAFTILFTLLFFGFLNKKEFKDRINWPTLFYLSGITGIVSVFGHIGLDKDLADSLSGLGRYMASDFELFILLMFGLISVIRLLVPATATMVIMATVFMPLAEMNGINPWVMGFIILILGELWYLPYQCSYYLQLQKINIKNHMYNENAFLRFNTIMNFARLGAIYASLPLWRSMGLL